MQKQIVCREGGREGRGVWITLSISLNKMVSLQMDFQLGQRKNNYRLLRRSKRCASSRRTVCRSIRKPRMIAIKRIDILKAILAQSQCHRVWM